MTMVVLPLPDHRQAKVVYKQVKRGSVLAQDVCGHWEIMTADEVYNRLVRALQLRLVLQQSVVCAPCDQAVHRSAFRLSCRVSPG